MKILIDAMGGDNAPVEPVRAAVMAANERSDVNYVLVGIEKLIKVEISKYGDMPKNISIVNATEIITNDDKPTDMIRQKSDSSMFVGFKMLRNSEGDGFISAGSTGALLVGASKYVGRIKGVHRAALAPAIPTEKGMAIIVDAGANTDCKPLNLAQFGIMGSIYMNKVMGVSDPKVGLVNIGTEESKGDELTKKAFPMLQKTPVNFIGNVEAREIPNGACDVIVCDGFVGNVVLKLMEGVGLYFYKSIKEIFLKNSISKLAALLVKNGLMAFKKKFDYTEYGGAILLGINAVVVKSHGSSNAKAFYHTIKQTEKLIETGVLEEIRKNIAIKE